MNMAKAYKQGEKDLLSIFSHVGIDLDCYQKRKLHKDKLVNNHKEVIPKFLCEYKQDDDTLKLILKKIKRRLPSVGKMERKISTTDNYAGGLILSSFLV